MNIVQYTIILTQRPFCEHRWIGLFSHGFHLVTRPGTFHWKSSRYPLRA